MKLLLDTHTFIWWDSEPEKLSPNTQVLPVVLAHVLALQSLPTHHKDPFDRLLITQTNVENAVLLSNDPVFEAYPVNELYSKSDEAARLLSGFIQYLLGKKNQTQQDRR
ncbi:MAG: hypothetical protein DDT30_02070 [Dehalococcoidia bacterium]|nr:hypothetical protein [Bacillota bacterium]